MADKPDQKIEDMIDKIRSGVVSPGSREGSDMIRKIALSSPRDLTTRLFHLPNPVLEKAMKNAGMKDDQIEEILGTDPDDKVLIETPEDPFAQEAQARPKEDLGDDLEDELEGEDLPNPYEYDPGEVMRNGPRPPGH